MNLTDEKIDSFQNPSHLKRASTEKLREIFNRYASKEIKGEKFMTSEDFVRKFLGLFPDSDFNEVSFMKKFRILL
jgi:solute carrier family 25 (mitochondrial aspartate/glutamate transporter), member 12/13